MPSIQFNPDQRCAIDTRKNTIVAAGAGSGKTSVLSERFASLLEKDKLPLDSILCLTFTRKAAAEMYARIHKRLLQSNDPAVIKLMENFDEARILTLDSFCSIIARSASRHYGIAPSFTTDEKRLLDIIDRCALSLIMRNRQHPLMRRLVAHLGFDSVRRDLFTSLALNAIPIYREESFNELARKHCALLENYFEKSLNTITELSRAIFDLDPKAHKKIESLQNFLTETKIPNSIPAPEDRANCASKLSLIAKDRVFYKNGKHGLDEELDLFKTQLNNAAEILRSLCEEDAIIAAGLLLDEFAKDLDSTKRTEGLLSFNDVALLARRILLENRDVRTWYKKQLSAIMIDEFQDNNSIQKDLLFLMAEKESLFTPSVPNAEDLDPHKLFFVGDEKQSIYRFRGADVSVFRLLSEDMARSNSASTMPLGINYRSEPELISFFNEIFPGVFGSAHNPWEARFTPLSAPQDKVINANKTCVEIHLYTQTDEDDDENPSAGNILNEAVQTALIISDSVHEGTHTYKDFAILFRSTTEQGSFERTLGDFGIPWTTPEPRGVFLEALANDFHAILRLLLFPKDRLSYATVLRSPFTMLSDPGVFAILQTEHEIFNDDENITLFEDRKEQIRWQRACALFNTLKERAKHEQTASLISYLWHESPYRHSILSREEYPQLQAQFDLLYEQAAAADIQGIPLPAYLDELSAFIGTTEKLKSESDPSGNANAVTLLTIHKSKGLEFPVVIIPRCGSKGKPITNEKPWYTHREAGPILNFPAEDSARNTKTGTWLFNEAKEREQAMALAELCRLFYVACTRAETKLYILATASLSQKNKSEWDSSLPEPEAVLSLIKLSLKERVKTRSFLELLAQGIGIDCPQHSALKLIPDRSRQEILTLIRERSMRTSKHQDESTRLLQGFHQQSLFPNTSPGFLRRSPSLIHNSTKKSTFKTDRKTSSTTNELPVDAILSNTNLHALFGTLCHSLIEESLNKRLHDPKDIAKRVFGREDILDKDIDIIVENAIFCANNFLNSSLGLKAQTAKKMESEFAFILPLSTSDDTEILFQGSIDLIFESDGDCIIIDYKTDRTQHEEDHAVQLAIYARAAPAFSTLPVKTALAYLRTGAILETDPHSPSAEMIISLAQEKQEHNG